jgi:hypothetical protein
MIINLWTYGERECPIERKKEYAAPFSNFYKVKADFQVDYEGMVCGQFFNAYPGFDRSWLNYKIIGQDVVDSNEINLICLPFYGWDYQHEFPRILSENQHLIDFAISNNVKILAVYLREHVGLGWRLEEEMKRYDIYNKISPKHFKICVNSYSNDHYKNLEENGGKLQEYIWYIDVFDKDMGMKITGGDLSIDSKFDIFRNFKYKFCFPFGSLYHRPFRIEALKLLIENELIDRDDIFYTITELNAEPHIEHFLKNSSVSNNDFILDETKQYLINYGLEKIFIYKAYLDDGHPDIPHGENEDKVFVISNSHHTPIQFNQSCVQVIFETRLHDHSITEKVYKPLFLGQPFLWHAQPHLKDYLESIGYRFYPWIDYSFDKIEDPMKRLYALFNEIKRLDNVDLVMEIKKHSHIINRHNRKVFRERMVDATEFEKFLKVLQS